MEKKYAKLTQDQIETARDTDLPSLLDTLGYTVTHVGRYHSTKEMDSLRIKDRKTWFRYSEQVGGDAIAFMQHFHNMTFVEAVEYLYEFNHQGRFRQPMPPPVTTTPEKADFTLPAPCEDNARVFAYLRKRGIAYQVVKAFIDEGLLYEEAEHHNCVFVGRNKDDEAVFASMRGTYDMGGSSFKGGVSGSDKNVAFRLPCDPAVDSVHVFEAPIDLMSYMTLKRDLRSNAVALCCLYDKPLESYLSDYPHLKSIVLCLDNDRWGLEASERIASRYTELGYAVTAVTPPAGKDWNEYLQAKKSRNRERGDVR